MKFTNRQGAAGALLDEYERALTDLYALLSGIADRELVAEIDPHTPDPDCVSIQKILAHVVHSGYAYAMYIQKMKSQTPFLPLKTLQSTATAYILDLQRMFAQTAEVLGEMSDSDFEKLPTLTVSWGELYNVEQLLEHAICHILRHRRQISKFVAFLKNDLLC